MRRSEAFEYLAIIVEPFTMYPPIGKIAAAVEAQDLQAAYQAVLKALKDDRISRPRGATPIKDRLEWWVAEVSKK